MTLLRIFNEDADESVAPADVAALVNATEPIDVRLDEVHAGPVQGVASEMQVQLKRGQPSFGYMQDENVLLVRLEHTLTCSSDGEGAQTDIQAVHLVAFRIIDSLEVSSATVAAWIETNVYFIAYPYVRQFFTQMTSVLGMPPVVLGYMKRDEWAFADSDTSSEHH